MTPRSLYECQGCPGRRLTIQACELAIRDAAEVQIVKNFVGDADQAGLPEGFCGDLYARGLPQQQTQTPEEPAVA
ncbi:MAG: hypothetical protein JWO47_165 [Candidatus Saccharibacteria bacterium]|nr:hypothetical protein [Candidatus Saccharibacteria bacterium]